MVWSALQTREADKGAVLTRDEVFEAVEDVMRAYDIPREYVPFRDPR